MNDLQVDNYSETAPHPVLIHSAKREYKKSNHISTTTSTSSNMELPVLQVAISMESILGSYIPHFNYIGVRLLELAVLVDTGTIAIILLDLQNDVELMTFDESLAMEIPTRWINNFNLKLLSDVQYAPILDVYLAEKAAHTNKTYFGSIVIHPIKIIVTFKKSTFIHKPSDNCRITAATLNWLEILPAIVNVDHMPLKLNSFIVNEALESIQTLMNRIYSKAILDLKSQMARIVGSYVMSLSVLGRPAGFARNIGSGVQDFFYEPYEGLLLGPQDFVLGIGKGTSSLVSNIVSGALTSTFSIVSTASDSLSRGMLLLSQDDEYTRTREENRLRRANDVSKGGMVAGMVVGGENIVSGIAAGVAGLVTKPMDEAKKGGAIGFLKGVGLGVLGVAVKPVIGVSDGLTSIAQGFSSQVSDITPVEHIRPMRAMSWINGDPNALLIPPVDLIAAYAQDYVISLAREEGSSDAFISLFSIPSQHIRDSSDDSIPLSIILSEKYIIFIHQILKLETLRTIGRRDKTILENRYRWSDISHFILKDLNIILTLFTSKIYHKANTSNIHNISSSGINKTGNEIIIHCNSFNMTMNLYTALYNNSKKMGDPHKCIPPEIINSNTLTDTIIPIEELYTFGSANNKKIQISLYQSENHILSDIRSNLLKTSCSDSIILDTLVWQLVWTWHCTHIKLNSSRCIALLIMNQSSSSIQITNKSLIEGRNLDVFGTIGFDTESNTILPGGGVVIFGYAMRPTLLDKAHVKMDILTSAFTAYLSTRQENRVSVESLGGCNLSFLERSYADWWAKYVLLVR